MSIPEFDPIRQDDVGTVVELVIKENGTAVDLTSATGVSMTFRTPSGAAHKTKTATKLAGTGGQIRYTLEAGVIDQHGKWPVQGKAVWANGTWRTTEAILPVTRALDEVDGE